MNPSQDKSHSRMYPVKNMEYSNPDVSRDDVTILIKGHSNMTSSCDVACRRLHPYKYVMIQVSHGQSITWKHWIHKCIKCYAGYLHLTTCYVLLVFKYSLNTWIWVFELPLEFPSSAFTRTYFLLWELPNSHNKHNRCRNGKMMNFQLHLGKWFMDLYRYVVMVTIWPRQNTYFFPIRHIISLSD